MTSTTQPVPDAAADFDVYAAPLRGARFVEASAGTGKTWTLSALHLRLVLERGLPVTQILVLTFTKAAAAELRMRIRTRLVQARECLEARGEPLQVDAAVERIVGQARHAGLDDAALLSRVEAAIAEFDDAPVRTIDAFCQRVLQEGAFTARLPFQVQIQSDDRALRLTAIRDFWRREIATLDAGSPLAVALADAGATPDKWDALLSAVERFPLAQPLWPPGAEVPGRAPLDASADIASLQRRMLEAAGAQLRATKITARIQTFNDQLIDLHRRLHGDEALAQDLRRRYPAALIDEFQDTDPVQLGIFGRIYHAQHDACVVYVGDPKQAIYAFRGADLHSYLHARDQAPHRATLGHNQRSTPELLHAVNTLFARHPRVFLEERLAFRAVQPGPAPRRRFEDRRPGPQPALRLWSLPDDGGHASRLRSAQAQALAARACAEHVAQTLAAGQRGEVLIDGRPLGGGDIAIIVSKHAQGQVMRRALARLGVASVERSQRGVIASAEAGEIEALLHAVLDPGHPGKLRAAMATTLLGASGEMLAAAMQDGPAGDAARARLDTMHARLLEWRQQWQRRGIAAMLGRVFDEMGVPERALPGPQGERRMTNLLHLLEMLSARSQEHALPQALLRWLSERRAWRSSGDDADDDEETQLRLESDRHLVQIVTVHASKGLEYPMVVAPFLWLGAARRDAGMPRRYHDADDRQLLDFRDLKGSPEERVVKARLDSEDAAQQLRLIYVAMTRAVHRLTLVINTAIHRKGTSSDYASIKGPLNWIVAGDGHTLESWRGAFKDKGAARSAQIREAWQALSRSARPDILLEALPTPTGTPQAAASEAAPIITLHRAQGPIAPTWRLASFSSLLRSDAGAGAADAGTGAADPDEAQQDALAAASAAERDEAPGALEPDEGDEGAAAATAAARPGGPADTSATALAADDILRFPRGTSSGDAVHAVLERADFLRPETWDLAVRSALDLHPPRLPDPAHAAMLGTMLRDLADTELAPGLRLRDVGMAQRLNELEFQMPLPSLKLAALQSSLAELGLRTPPLAQAGLPFHGQLRGFIDMVFEHEGRYHIVDWKSNHLGDTPAHYAAPALERAMVQHGYHLQHVLYAIALRRHLQRCLGPQQADHAWGGAFVLFVRGIRPAQGASTGVFHRRLDPHTLDALAAHFD